MSAPTDPPEIPFGDPRLRLLNEKNRILWADVSHEIATLFSDSLIADLTLKEFTQSQANSYDFKRFSILESLRRVKQHRDEILSTQARRGARARKPNAFQLLCEDIVRQHPRIDEHEFFQKLEAQKGFNVVIDCEPDAIFIQLEGKDAERKTSKALKHVLHRTKKRLQSR